MYGYYSFPTTKVAGDTLSLGQELANELSSPFYEFNRNGAVKVEGKKEMKKRGIASPNIADALCITEFFYNVAAKIFKRKKESTPSRFYKPGPNYFNRKKPVNRDNWMVL
jgi:phage terminase large subunit